MGHGDSVAGCGLFRHPAADAGNELHEGLTAVGCSFNVREPQREAVGIARVNLVDFFASPRTIIDIGEFSRYGRLKTQRFRGMLRS